MKSAIIDNFFLLFASAFLAAGPLACDYQRSVFSYSKELGLSSQLRPLQDIVILKDGTQLLGQVEELPALKFSFGTIRFPVEQAEFFTLDRSGLFKLQTRDNEIYIGNAERSHLSFKGGHIRIDLSEVDAVLLKPRIPLGTDQALTVGEDFDLNEWSGTPEDSDEEDGIEFISRTHSNLDENEELLALKECQKCFVKPAPDRMPRVDFSMDDLPEEEEKEDMEALELQDPLQTGGSAVRKNVCKMEAVPRFYDGLVYVNAASAGFYIKPEKVTNREYKKFVDAINYRAPIHWLGGAIPSGMEEEPVVNVTYRDAFLYSVWAGKRLPTQEELSIAAELNVILTDEGEQLAEWTATPTMQLVKHLQGSDSVKIGPSFSPSHQVFSRYRIISMNNDDANSCIGFRTALDAY